MSCEDEKGSSGGASDESCDCDNGAGGNTPGGNGPGGNGPGGSGDYPWWTAPFDARFPNMNQAKHCYVYFLDYHRCIKAKGDCESGPCEYFKKVWKSMCPNEWTKKWTEQIENGTFAGRI